MREANDRGYECLVVADATESYFPQLKRAALEMIVAQGGIVGWAAPSADVIAALHGYTAPPPPPPAAAPLPPVTTAATTAAAASGRRTLLAVSGTLQDGFELRANLDAPGCAALLVGSAVVRGVRAFLDIKEEGAREHAGASPARVNPANVVTGNMAHANLYAVYLVHESVVLKALLGEPRYLAIAPDAVRLDLRAARTSHAVVALLHAAARELDASAPPPSEVSICTVLSTYMAPSFVPLPAALPGEPSMTSFPEGLAAFAGVALSEARTGGIAEAALRTAEATALDAAACRAARELYASGPLTAAGAAAAGEPWRPRLAALWDADQLARYAAAAGYGGGAFGAELASLVAVAPPPPYKETSPREKETAAALAAAASAAAAAAVSIGGLAAAATLRSSSLAASSRQLLVAFGAGWLLRELWARTDAVREARAMKRRSVAEAAISAALAAGTTLDGEAQVRCSRGVGHRAFGVSRADTALLLIDMQVDFLHRAGRLGRHYDASRHAALAKATAQVERLLAAARKAGLTIAHSRSHRYGADVRADLLRGPQPGAPALGDDADGAPQHFGAVDVGYDLLPSLRALPGEVVVDKWTFGAFASTDLEAQLRARGVRKVLLAGILTNVCVFATAVQACDRFFRVCLVEDAAGAFKPDWHEKAVELLSGPQTAPGHAAAAVGLYFGETATVAAVEEALERL